MAGGPRDYSTGTERALFRLAKGTCYAPTCRVPIMRGVEGHAVVNVEIGHIRGALPKSARFDPFMTDEERASFSNLILICTAHHKLIDRIERDSHTVEVLKEWKAEAEVQGGLEALAEMDGMLADDRLADLIQEAVQQLGPTRELTVELSGGVVVPDYGVVAIDVMKFHDVLKNNPGYTDYERVLVTTTRNVGFTDASVEGHELHYKVQVSDDPDISPLEMVWLGQNLYPSMNPQLPKRLLSGASLNWYTPFRGLASVATRASKPVLSVFARVVLSSGEFVASPEVPWVHLPVEL